MALIDWRELYASNQAVIAQAQGRGSGHPPPPRTSAGPERAHEWRVTAAGLTRRAVVHAPPDLDPQTPTALVCMLHGCTQDPAAFAAATGMNEVADRHGFVVVYPEQTAGENQQRCWNWFSPAHQGRGAGEPASLAALVRDVMGTTSPWTIDAGRVFVAGLSAGGAMAAVMGATYPDLFAAVAVHSGLAYRSATDVRSAFSAMARGAEGADVPEGPVPTMVVHGSEDRTVAAVNAEHVLRQAMRAGRGRGRGDGAFELSHPSTSARDAGAGGHTATTSRWAGPDGAPRHELLLVEGMGHAWSGGAAGAAYTDPRGPDASEAIWRFFAGVTAGRDGRALVPAAAAG